jgi:hypothetical protein
MEAYKISGKHEFRTGQTDDEGFSTHRLCPEIEPTVDSVFRQILSETVKLARMLGISINLVSTAPFR